MVTPPPDCRTCGACCSTDLDTPTWADMTPADVARVSPRTRKRLAVWRCGGETSYATAAEWREPPGGPEHVACVFLRGTPGRRVYCGIYETRPDVCRRFRPGSRPCLEARRDLEQRLDDAA